jgi:hypothetical protein
MILVFFFFQKLLATKINTFNLNMEKYKKSTNPSKKRCKMFFLIKLSKKRFRNIFLLIHQKNVAKHFLIKLSNKKHFHNVFLLIHQKKMLQNVFLINLSKKKFCNVFY